jgi:hypothetical protein
VEQAVWGCWAARAEKKGKGRGKRGLGFFQTFSNSFFKLLNYKLFSKIKHFKPFASFQIILKTFKTSLPHTKKIPCKQNMMHKHLLLLNY